MDIPRLSNPTNKTHKYYSVTNLTAINYNLLKYTNKSAFLARNLLLNGCDEFKTINAPH